MNAGLREVVILGWGYTGRYLEKELRAHYPDLLVHKTTRDGRDSSIVFNQEDDRTWHELPPADLVFCLFPLSLRNLDSFSQLLYEKTQRVVVTSSTGFFLTQQEDERVTEDSPLDLTIERAQAEETLRKKGAIVVQAAGIYGKGRNPLDWLRHGRVGSSSKFVNFIHVEDLSQILRRAAEMSPNGKRWIACDEKSYRWSELVETWKKSYGLQNILDKPSKRRSKLIDAGSTRQDLKVKLRYPSVIEGVAAIDPDTTSVEKGHP